MGAWGWEWGPGRTYKSEPLLYTYHTSTHQQGSGCSQIKSVQRASLAVQWLRLRTSSAGGAGSSPGQRTKIPHAAQCSQKNNCQCITQHTVNTSWSVPVALTVSLIPGRRRACSSPSSVLDWKSPEGRMSLEAGLPHPRPCINCSENSSLEE